MNFISNSTTFQHTLNHSNISLGTDKIKDVCLVNSAINPFGKEWITQCPSFKDTSEMTNTFMLKPQLAYYNSHKESGDFQECAPFLKDILKEQPLSKNFQKCTQYNLNLFRTPKKLQQNAYLKIDYIIDNIY